MRKCTLRELKKGDFFTLRDYGEFPDESRVYVRGDYERTEKKYSVYRFSDTCAETLKRGAIVVYTGFTF